MKSLEIVVLVVLLVIVACLKGFILFDFNELEAFISYASPLIYGHCFVEIRLKSEGNKQGKGT